MSEQQNLVLVIDDDASVRKSLSRLLRSAGYDARTYASAEEFLADGAPHSPACAVLDLAMPGLDGLELQSRMLERGMACGIVFLTGHGDLEAGIEAMKHGAMDFLSKPIDESRLLAAVEESLNVERQRVHDSVATREARHRFSSLTPRELEVMKLVVAGRLNKLIAVDLNISEKTVKAHRAKVMHKTRSRSVAELVRLYIAAQGGSDPG